MAKMSVVSALTILIIFLCSTLYVEGVSWASCSCGPCAPGCKSEKLQLGGPNSRYCICQCNCNPSYNPPILTPSVPSNPPPPPPPPVPTTPPPPRKTLPRPTPNPIPIPPKSSPKPPPTQPQPRPSFPFPRKPQPPPSDEFDVFGCVNIMGSLGKCLSEIGNLFGGSGPGMDSDCCDTFNHFTRSCVDGDEDMLPPEVVQYCHGR